MAYLGANSLGCRRCDIYLFLNFLFSLCVASLWMKQNKTTANKVRSSSFIVVFHAGHGVGRTRKQTMEAKQTDQAFSRGEMILLW
jgi:hypothetical protein